ncbi:hypothetical protein T261_01498 [Streptomyces lydicus]|nr:hypothetical protein T261_01498 [Streptomyces lydicus]
MGLRPPTEESESHQRFRPGRPSERYIAVRSARHRGMYASLTPIDLRHMTTRPDRAEATAHSPPGDRPPPDLPPALPASAREPASPP